MATSRKSAPHRASPATKRRSAAASNGGAPDAVKLLTADHRAVKALFQEYQELVDHDAEDDEKLAVARQVCMMLTVHAQIEEELFYPAAKTAIKETELVDEAAVEHASAKELIAQIEASDPSEDLFDAKVKVLGELIDHHVKEEEGELFPQARKSKMDLQRLGEKLSRRNAELMEEMGMTEGAEELAEARA